MNNLGIDVRTKDLKKLIGRLKRLKSTRDICNGGVYHEDRNYSQIHIVTTLTEDQLDNWLYTVNHGCEYIGVFANKR